MKKTSKDERPPMWIGHVSISVPDVASAKDFFLKLGMRDVFPDASEIAILELRAGTHLIVQHSESDIAPGTTVGFDLMVDDIKAMHSNLADLGVEPSTLEPGSIHTTFTVTEPNGHVITYLSSHNSGLPV